MRIRFMLPGILLLPLVDLRGDSRQPRACFGAGHTGPVAVLTATDRVSSENSNIVQPPRCQARESERCSIGNHCTSILAREVCHFVILDFIFRDGIATRRFGEDSAEGRRAGFGLCRGTTTRDSMIWNSWVLPAYVDGALLGAGLDGNGLRFAGNLLGRCA